MHDESCENGYTVIEILCMIIMLGLITGWGLNLYKVTQLDFDRPYKAEIIRGVGILVAPLGVVAGFMEIEDK